VLEVALIFISVRVDPLSFDELILVPVSSQSHLSLGKHVGALAVLSSVGPQSRVDVLVGVGVQSLSVFDSILELSIIRLILGGVGEFSDSML